MVRIPHSLEVPLLRGNILLDRFTKVIVGSVTPLVLTRPSPSPFVLATKVGIIGRRSGGLVVQHGSSQPSFFSQSSFVREDVGDICGLPTDICAFVLAILVNILELPEVPDKVDIITEIYDDVFRASIQAVIEKSERLKQILNVSDGPE